MKFTFKAEMQGLLITFTAERIYCSKQNERFRLTLVGSSDSIIVQNNRPAVEAKKLNKSVQWHVVEGIVQDKAALIPVYKKHTGDSFSLQGLRHRQFESGDFQ